MHPRNGPGADAGLWPAARGIRAALRGLPGHRLGGSSHASSCTAASAGLELRSRGPISALRATMPTGHGDTPGPMLESHTPGPRLLDRLRLALRTRHYSRRTEEAYVGWVRRFVRFSAARHPAN